MNHLRRKMAIATWSAPREGNIYGQLTLDCTEAVRYMEHLRQTTGQKVTITHLVGKALGCALADTPSLNGRIVLGRYVPFETADVSFLVALEDGSNLFKVKLSRVDELPVAEIARQLSEGAARLHSKQDAGLKQAMNLLKMLPRPLVPLTLWLNGFLGGSLGVQSKLLGIERFPFGSAIITSVGMLGFDVGYAPPTPFARVPVLLLVGAMTPRPFVNAQGQLEVRPQVTVCATVDHRFVDGYQLGAVAKTFRRVIEDPWSLEAQAAPLAALDAAS